MTTEPFKDGVAGESAKRQYLKRSKATKDKRVDLLGPRLGKLANLYFGDSKSSEAWEKGAVGEIYVGKTLDALCEKHGFAVLHDRKIPKSPANIDHILITNRGVFVVDAKNYKGLIRIDEQGGILSQTVRTLYVGNRKQTKLLEGVKKQVEIIDKFLRKSVFDIPTFGVLAFYDATWPLFFKPTEIDGVLINSKGVEVVVLDKPILALMDIQKTFTLLKQAFTSKE